MPDTPATPPSTARSESGTSASVARRDTTGGITVSRKLSQAFTQVALLPVALLATVLLAALVYFFFFSLISQSAADIQRQGLRQVSQQGSVFHNEAERAKTQIQAQIGSGLSNRQLAQAMASGDAGAVYEVLAGYQVQDPQTTLSFVTVVNKSGRVVAAATNPDRSGDLAYTQATSTGGAYVAPVKAYLEDAFQGGVHTGIEPFAPELLRTELVNDANAIKGVTTPGQTLADQAAVQGRNPDGSGKLGVERRGLVLYTIQPITTGSGDVLGAIIAGQLLNRNPQALLSSFERIIPSTEASATVTLGDTRVLTSEAGGQALGAKLVGDLWKQLQAGEPTASARDLYSKPTYMKAYRLTDPAGKQLIGSLIVAVDAQRFTDITDRQTRQGVYLLAIALILMVAAAAAGLFLANRQSRRLTSPIVGAIDELRRTTERVSRGDFDARAMISSESGTELEDLGNQFNFMTGRVSTLVRTETERDEMQRSITDLLVVVSNSAEGDFTQKAAVTEGVLGALADSFNLMVDDLSALIREVQGSANQVSGSANAILTSTEQMATGAELQASQVTNASQAVEEMATSIRQVAANADQAASAAQQAADVAQEGGNTVLETIEGMRRIRSTVQDTAQKIKSLGESSIEIGKIVQVIEDIAGQTNLLALNATIEAARAGELGRGFTVVAEQVRELAERSAKATNDIAQLIQTIQAETQDAVSAMEKGTSEVEQGTKLADEAGQALDRIREVVQQSTSLIQDISLAARQQDIASAGVVTTMNEVSTITRQSLEGSRQSAATATALTAITNRLADSVSRFRLALDDVQDGSGSNQAVNDYMATNGQSDGQTDEQAIEQSVDAQAR